MTGPEDDARGSRPGYAEQALPKPSEQVLVDVESGELIRHRRKSPLAGAVDWQLAARTGAALVPAGPRVTRFSAEQVVAQLAESSVRAEGPVREVTGLIDDRPVPAARIVDRPGWIDAAAASMAQLTGESGTPADRASVRGRLAGKPAGVQVGAMLAFLSTAILGQYDPFSGDDGMLLLVAPNIVAVERVLGVHAGDFRLWVCLHEVTHRVQFSSAPWLGEYMRDNVTVLGDVGDESFDEMLSRLAAVVRERRQRGAEPSDDPADRGVLGLLRATQAPAQREALDRLLMLGTLLEGHADHVMDAVGPAVVPSVAQIRRAFDERRRRPANPVQRLLRALLGVDAKVAQYVRGKAFVDEVVETVGMQRFNTVWTDADTLPRTDEITEPGRWVARVLG
ncbi:zinc-dependent metalloprotease [Nocardia sp. alder85J]|uniref:zinc-dependent metalloprotease n=1 Tax=Nocardia sp. alder85J TaxID=2862949 RepID=UPI001CD69790|nr:zinc-dependent metalloprotease [Nocardia sp. alder85J]MCX4093560.1 zinc-dependent metalloprotease [Nocardia sp. alder85J]